MGEGGGGGGGAVDVKHTHKLMHSIVKTKRLNILDGKLK